MFAQRPSFRFLAVGAIFSLITLTFLLLNTRRSRDLTSQYILKTPRPVSHCPPSSSTQPIPNNTNTDSQLEAWEFHVDRDGNDHGLSEEQCRIAFPKLFGEIEKSATLRPQGLISYEELRGREIEDGMVRCIIDRGELYIVEYAPQPVTASRARATLNSLHRALKAIPNRHHLPSIEFIFTSEDFANDPTGHGPVWSYSKRDTDSSVWLMPDFGYWAWPEVQVGPYHEVRRRIAAIDDGEINPDDGSVITPGISFQDKKKQLVWRGSLNTNPGIRGKLLKASSGKSWASVRVIDWDDENDIRYNLLPIEDHCRYMFLAHTEGRSFSGRGKYLLNCRSVVISHPLIWREAHHAALVSSGPDANFVEVKEDFSDMSRMIDYLIDNPRIAERIAENSVRTFRDRYLTPAAESCYWRQLVRSYASVCDFEPLLFDTTRDGKKVSRGVSFETWMLTH